MGYAGYTAAKLPPPKASALQAALWSVDNMECLEVMSKLVRNTAVAPSEDKFKRIKLSNSKVKTTIVDIKGGVSSLLAMGWVYDKADKDFLMLPKGIQMTMKEVRAIEDTKDRLKKQVSYQSRMSKASALPGNADKSAIRSAMEADRLERSSREPVTQGSTAQALPGGANITTAGDMGLNSGGCC
ncbi:hypothetical protein WJX79_000144 [Trebouxia sp. C0005]|nr:MAG: hypothetical protein FRX49_07897 [Trebouxia sp. A1-2]